MNVTYSNSTFTSRDGFRLFTQNWLVETPKAAIVLVHGLGEHSSRYAHVAKRFNAAGYSIYTYDQMGHGQSEGHPTYCEKLDIWSHDLGHFIKRVRMETEKLPLYVLAHSMGGTVTTYLAVTEHPPLDGLILSAPALVAGEAVSPMLIRVAGLLSWLAPKLPAQKLDSSTVSRDPKVVLAYNSDPLVYHGGVPARTGAEMLRAFDVIREGTPKIKYPMLVMHGKSDQLVDVKGSMQLNARAGSADKTLKLYDDLYHEILNEPEQNEVMDVMLAWLDERVARGSAEKQTHHQKRAKKNAAKIND
ncbi:MAG: lysophospholipase [Candidatus Promineifilaceae bacterium]